MKEAMMKIVQSLQLAITTYDKLDKEANRRVPKEDYPCELLRAIYYNIGEENIDTLIQLLQDANDSDMRCPK